MPGKNDEVPPERDLVDTEKPKQFFSRFLQGKDIKVAPFIKATIVPRNNQARMIFSVPDSSPSNGYR